MLWKAKGEHGTIFIDRSKVLCVETSEQGKITVTFDLGDGKIHSIYVGMDQDELIRFFGDVAER